MIRITGGKYRGRRIDSPRDKAVRPTTGMVRESLFNRLQGLLPGGLSNCRFLDLFAGSGLMGLEALSRGAAFVMAVEKHPQHLRLIQQNYETLDVDPTFYHLVRGDVKDVVQKPWNEAPFNVIFMDPPYGTVALEEIVNALRQNGWLCPEGGQIFIEESKSTPTPLGFERRDFGDTTLFTGSVSQA